MKRKLLVGLLILIGPIVFILLLAAILPPPPEKIDEESAMRTVLPSPAPGLTLVSENYSPNSRCFDACPTYTRTYTYPEGFDYCTPIFDGIKADPDGLRLFDDTAGSSTAKELSVDSCKAEASTKGLKPFGFSVGQVMYGSVNADQKTLQELAEINIYPDTREIFYSMESTQLPAKN